MDSGLIENLLLVFHLIVAILLIGVVLMQRSEGGALGIGGGGGGGGGPGGGLFSARGAASTLTRMTAVLAAIFMLTSITLAILAGQDESGESIFEQPAAETPETPAEESGAPAIPQVPTEQ